MHESGISLWCMLRTRQVLRKTGRADLCNGSWVLILFVSSSVSLYGASPDHVDYEASCTLHIFGKLKIANCSSLPTVLVKLELAAVANAVRNTEPEELSTSFAWFFYMIYKCYSEHGCYKLEKTKQKNSQAYHTCLKRA